MLLKQFKIKRALNSKKKKAFFFLLILSLLPVECFSKEELTTIKSTEINAHIYYERAYKLAEEAWKKRKEHRMEEYKQKMEECLAQIKEGVEKSVLYLPPKSHVMGVSPEGYNKNINKYSFESIPICAAIQHIYHYLNDQIESYTDNKTDKKELLELSEKYKIFIRFLHQIVFSPSPPPDIISVSFVAGLALSYRDLAQIYKIIGEPGQSQIIEEYLRVIDVYGKQLTQKYIHSSKKKK